MRAELILSRFKVAFPLWGNRRGVWRLVCEDGLWCL